MSELQFPKDPIVGQEYDFAPYKYYWDGVKWKTKGIGYNPVEDVVITGTTSGTAGTQTAHTHGLGYTPKRVDILPTSNGVIYQSASPDATNLYVKGSAASLTFIAYAK